MTLEQKNLIESATLNIFPSIEDIMNSNQTNIPKRILDNFSDLGLEDRDGYNMSAIFMKIEITDILENGFDKIKKEIHDKISNDDIVKTKILSNLIGLIDDIISIQEKLDIKLGDLDTQFGINFFNNDILAIYRQVFFKPLSEIEAQVDQQITTIANSIMLRKLTQKKEIGEDSETKAMTAYVLGEQS